MTLHAYACRKHGIHKSSAGWQLIDGQCMPTSRQAGLHVEDVTSTLQTRQTCEPTSATAALKLLACWQLTDTNVRVCVCVHAGKEEGMWWQWPWRLRAAVVHGWPAHSHSLLAINACL